MLLPLRWWLRRGSGTLLLPVVELLLLVPLLLRIPFLHRGCRTHQRMRLLRLRSYFFPLRRMKRLRVPVLGLGISVLLLRLRIPFFRRRRSLHLDYRPLRLGRSVSVAGRRERSEGFLLPLRSTRLIPLRGARRLRFWPDRLRPDQWLLVQTSARLSLSLLKRSRRCRRSSLRHYLPIDYGRRRLYWCRASRAEHALAHRLDRHHVRNPTGCGFSPPNSPHVPPPPSRTPHHPTPDP